MRAVDIIGFLNKKIRRTTWDDGFFVQQKNGRWFDETGSDITVSFNNEVGILYENNWEEYIENKSLPWWIHEYWEKDHYTSNYKHVRILTQKTWAEIENNKHMLINSYQSNIVIINKKEKEL